MAYILTVLLLCISLAALWFFWMMNPKERRSVLLLVVLRAVAAAAALYLSILMGWQLAILIFEHQGMEIILWPAFILALMGAVLYAYDGVKLTEGKLGRWNVRSRTQDLISKVKPTPSTLCSPYAFSAAIPVVTGTV